MKLIQPFSLFWFAALLFVSAKGSLFSEDRIPPVIEIQLPGSVPLVFKPVFLGIDTKSPVAAKEVIVGNRGEPNFREWLTRCSLAGSFLGEKNGKADWLYYIAEKELSEAQWTAILGGRPIEPDLPKTAVTYAEIQVFIEKLNAWAHVNAPASLPTHDGQLGYFRLPTEAEWEFAARGGVAVSAEVFDQATPYADGDLESYEWTFENSSGRLQPVGLLKPNPLGLYDMLGNAAEMVDGHYSFEYNQGRIGGGVIRGSKFNEPSRNCRSSRRSEVPPLFDEHGQPRHDPEVGFRLVIASSIFGDGKTLEAAWTNYVKDRHISSPGIGVSSAGVGKVETELAEARLQIERFREQLAKTNQSRTADTDVSHQIASLEREKRDLLNKINLLSANVINASSATRAAEEKNAASWVRVASLNSKWLYNTSVAISVIAPLAETTVEKEHLRSLRTNLASAWAGYQLALRSMASIDPEMLNKALGDMRGILKEQNLPQQAALLTALETHVERARRLDIPTQEKALADFTVAVDHLSK